MLKPLRPFYDLRDLEHLDQCFSVAPKNGISLIKTWSDRAKNQRHEPRVILATNHRIRTHLMKSSLHGTSRIGSERGKLSTKLESIELHQVFETASGSFADKGIAKDYTVNILPNCLASRFRRGRPAKIASRKRIPVARAN